ncbi:chemotaxis protein CheW [Vibrio sp. NH-UV-68]|uniref:chemotaxis protein CheW n=1 Tax=unclassified Vibrio TaxID=2614977 RepID=UPI0036F26A1E
MTSQSLLSSEQALDDYFSALLAEEVEQDEIEPLESDATLAIVAKTETHELEPMMQSVQEKSYFHTPATEVEVPNLEDVERLLKQLETDNPVAELDLEQVMVQNTLEIAQVQPETVTAVEEIQEWDLVEPELDIDVEQSVETVTESIEPIAQVAESLDTELEVVTEGETFVDTNLTTDAELATQPSHKLGDWHSTQRDVEFPVLYFDVNGVTFAVPLDELGGIHRIAEMNHLIGRPDWYLGLQTSREAQLDVVDTAKWVMSEKLNDDTYKENYQYIVMLGESMWGLASTQLKGTEALDPAMVRWRETAGKRPWLAGMVKEKMCALIHVEALIAMLNAGLDVKALDN